MGNGVCGGWLSISRPAGDLRLELEEGLQRPLRRLRLVGRVGGEEFAAAGDGVAGRGHDAVVDAAAQEGDEVGLGHVLRGEIAHEAAHFLLAQAGREVEVALQADLLGQRGEEGDAGGECHCQEGGGVLVLVHGWFDPFFVLRCGYGLMQQLPDVHSAPPLPGVATADMSVLYLRGNPATGVHLQLNESTLIFSLRAGSCQSEQLVTLRNQ